MRYTLLIDKNEDILNIQEMGLRYFYGGQILTSRDSQGALEILKKEGCPEIIIMDIKILDENESALYQHFIDLDFRCPLIACSAFMDNETLRKKFPAITSVIELSLIHISEPTRR